jgi:predicted nuclease of predicted toxin-antitoxin system
MRLLLDQDVYATTAKFLTGLGHDVVRAAQVGLSRASDQKLLSTAREQDRILVTRDRDFGALVFVNALGAGVLYLRMLPSTQDSVHNELARVLQSYSEEEMKKAFVVVEADGHRFRRLPDRS